MSLPHDVFLVKLVSLAGSAGAVISLLYQATVDGARFSWLTTVISVGGAAATAVLLYALKERSDRRKLDRGLSLKVQAGDQAAILERERLIDGRIAQLIDELTQFYTLKDKEKEAINVMYKESCAQKDTLIQQQRELIAQQAATLAAAGKLGMVRP